VKRPFRKLCDMIADIRGPTGDQRLETNRVRGEQRAGRLFEMRLVAARADKRSRS